MRARYARGVASLSASRLMGSPCGVYLKYERGVMPKAFLNMDVKALGVP
jgi:hypothetical protein